MSCFKMKGTLFRVMIQYQIFNTKIFEKKTEIQNEEDSGVELWHYIRTETNLVSESEALAFKYKLKSKILLDLKFTINVHTICFKYTRPAVIKDEYKGNYIKCISKMFKKYRRRKYTMYSRNYIGTNEVDTRQATSILFAH